MKKTSSASLAVLCAIFASGLFSCATASSVAKKDSEQESVQEQTAPAQEEAVPQHEQEPAKTIPTVTFKGRGVKIEAEDMFLDGLSMYKDDSASQGYAVKIDASGTAACKVVLSEGTWECLAREQAFQTDESELFIDISGTYYKVYPSNPPLGSWELTTRSPVYLHIEQETTIDVCLNASSPTEKGSGGMNIDYIQFVKMR